MSDEEKAREVRDKICFDKSPFALACPDADCACLAAILSALSAVREEQKERDAKIADQWADAASEGDGEVWIASKIACAIRSTEGATS